MGNFPWEIPLAIIGIVIPFGAFVWEFVVVGRKRLGYRVQMDTTAIDEVTSGTTETWQQLWRRGNGERPADPSFVLLRIENSGTINIDQNDYSVLDSNKVGVRVSFPERRVVGMVVTELSHEFLRESFGPDSGLGVRDLEEADSGRIVGGEIELPKVPLNRDHHYKVLAALERVGPKNSEGPQRQFPPPNVVGGIKGGVGGGGIQETQGRTGMPRWITPLISILMFVILVEPLVFSRFFSDNAPLDCATGQVTLAGSTAFSSVLKEATDRYQETCPGAAFKIETTGSLDGLVRLDQWGRDGAGSPDDLLAFSDGAKQSGEFPQLLPRPMAFVLYTLVINAKAQVQDLPLTQVKELFQSGRYKNWERLNGSTVPISIIDRDAGSGTRNTFEKHVLKKPEPGRSSNDCQTLISGASGVVRCERESTTAVLNEVAKIPGAIGYSELGEAARRRDVRMVRIDGQSATLTAAESGDYPFGETEYAYTYGEPRASSLAASFLRFLTNEVGKDIIRSHGDRPCAELQNPVRCRPM
jgi:phosphate transport system substrate-binding protein